MFSSFTPISQLFDLSHLRGTAPCPALLEGKTDCPISGVFGAGKTRAAAAIIAGLITVDPSLKIMILTKENVASQAFAEHIIGLSLPSWIETKIGRLVGFMALHNQTTGATKLDIPSAHRHDVLGSKQVIIGCGGGFRHECASKYSPVAKWMSEVDLTLRHLPRLRFPTYGFLATGSPRLTAFFSSSVTGKAPC